MTVRNQDGSLRDDIVDDGGRELNLLAWGPSIIKEMTKHPNGPSGRSDFAKPVSEPRESGIEWSHKRWSHKCHPTVVDGPRRPAIPGKLYFSLLKQIGFAMGRLSRSESCPEDEINFVGDWSDTEVARRWWRLCPGRLDEDKSPATCIWRGRAGYVSALIRGFFFSVVSSVHE